MNNDEKAKVMDMLRRVQESDDADFGLPGDGGVEEEEENGDLAIVLQHLDLGE